MALHGHQAKLEIIKGVPYIQSTASTQSDAGNIGTQTVEEVEFKDIGLELSILPNIQHDGLVSLTLDQKVSVQSGVFNDIPVVQSRNIQTSFVIEEGETIMIGGIMEDSSQERIEGVPLLKDIPLLGHFFTNTHDEHRSTELVILITPRLVDPWSTAETALRSLWVKCRDGECTSMESDRGDERSSNQWIRRGFGNEVLAPSSCARRAAPYPQAASPVLPGSVRARLQSPPTYCSHR
jgi:type II secretory pathway component GspD/PulD (secretin)